MTFWRKSLLVTVLLSVLSQHAWGFSVVGGRIKQDDGQEVQLRGVNWFGFETQDHIVHGLWARNWQDMIQQMQDLGFNAVRLPFCPATLAGVTPTSIDYSRNPTLLGLNSLQLLDVIVEEFDRRGMYVLLDHHRPDCQSISELWYTSTYKEADWIADLVFVTSRYRHLSRFLGLDLKNEPHGQATWGTGTSATDWKAAAERATNAILAAAPNLLIFVEGIQENPLCSGTISHWWGGNLEPQACYPLAIPVNRLVLSPHVYGPDVFMQPYFDAPDFPANMPAIWEAHFGYLAGQGYAVVVGEFGGRYGHGGDARDVTWQNSFVDYLSIRSLTSSFYWSWNPNSGDTGGILQDDWQTVWTDKITLLQRLWGSAPPPSPPPPAVDLIGAWQRIQLRRKSATSRLTGNYTLQNIGSQAASAFSARIYLSTDATWDAQDALLTERNESGLAAGKTVQRSIGVNLATPAAKTYILLRIDPANQVIETNENNNVIAQQLP